ncbi:MAG TPA: DUF3459 domain-containing protein, partial [Gemmatimonadaceae bacterium]|nr:DUF3459 domain-containing protein [Gemmatimonadaceae bacterium]
QYFISHGDEQLVASVREGRRTEFEAFGWGHDVPDPQAEETFRRSRLDWDRRRSADHEQMLMLYRDLLALRREEPLLRPDAARVAVDNGDSWIALLRESTRDWEGGPSEALLALFNCSGDEVDLRVPGSDARAWTLRLFTDAFGYGGSAEAASTIAAAGSPDEPRRLLGAQPRSVRVPAWSAALYSAATSY